SFLKSQTATQLEGLSKLLSYFRNEIPESDKKGLIELVWTGKKEEEPSVREVTGVAQEILSQIPSQKLRLHLERYTQLSPLTKTEFETLKKDFKEECEEIRSEGLWKLTGRGFIPFEECSPPEGCDSAEILLRERV